MTEHTHAEFTPGCHRCDLSLSETDESVFHRVSPTLCVVIDDEGSIGLRHDTDTISETIWFKPEAAASIAEGFAKAVDWAINHRYAVA